MRDRDFLAWLHERLEYVLKIDPTTDYMHKLRAIVLQTDSEKCSEGRNISANNSKDMRALMASYP